jgi:S1-C subfamily serine protease
MQISVPIQPGNSGGALFNSKGNIVGITTSSLNSIFMAKYKGNIPQNVNYAVKTEYLKVLTKSVYLDGKNIVKDMSLKDKAKIIKNYICLIKTY